MLPCLGPSGLFQAWTSLVSPGKNSLYPSQILPPLDLSPANVSRRRCKTITSSWASGRGSRLIPLSRLNGVATTWN